MVVESDGLLETAANPWITRTQAIAMIGVSRTKLEVLIACKHLTTRRNIFNKAQILVSRADVERVAREGIEGMTPRRKGETGCTSD